MSEFELSLDEKEQLAPSGVLRVALAVGPTASAVWCVRDADGIPRGVTVGIAEALAAHWRLPLEFIETASSAEIVETANSGHWTLSFVPIDDERRKLLEVGANHYLGVSTYLARKDKYGSVDEVDLPGVRIVGVAGTATIRSAVRSVEHATITAIPSLDDAVALFRSGEADAVALGKESIMSLARSIEGTHAVTGHFHEAGTAVVTPPGHHHALAAASRGVEAFKRNGRMRVIFDTYGMGHADIAP